MKRLAGIALFVPLALVFGAFTVENLQPVTVNFWPLPAGIEVPVSVWTFGALAAGVFIGIAVGWLAGSRWRRRARHAERQLRRLEPRDGAGTPPPAASAAAPNAPADGSGPRALPARFIDD